MPKKPTNTKKPNPDGVPLELGSQGHTQPDSDEIRRCLRLFIPPGKPTEIRALKVPQRGGKFSHTMLGFYDDQEKAVEAALSVSSAAGVYFVPNPINRALLARSDNRMKRAGRGDATTDADVLSRRYLFVDADPKRPSGVSSTAEEHKAALERVHDIRELLKKKGWPDPIVADSGNGGHLVYPIELPTNDEGLIERVLKGLAFRFSDQAVTVDTSVFNPGRIWKLYGSLARKGDHLPDRPHRISRILEVPRSWTV